MQSIQMQLSKKQKTFSDIFSTFLEFRLNFKHFEKKMTLVGYVFLNFQHAKGVVSQCPKGLISEVPLISDMVNGPKRCWNLHDSTFIIVLITMKWLIWKKSVLMIWKILGLFVNTLAVDDKYSLFNGDNFNAINSDAIISETKNFFWIVFFIFKIKIKFWTFWKK